MMQQTTRCPICGGISRLNLWNQSQVPIYMLQRHESLEAAQQADCGDLTYWYCASCQWAFNAAHSSDSITYLVDYEASRSHSSAFRDYLNTVCDQVIRWCDLKDRCVVEVGCGDGAFLTGLRQRVKFNGHGFDTSTTQPTATMIKFHHGAFDPAGFSPPPEVLLLRHLLEHQSDPRAFLASLLVPSVTQVYIEVPAWEWVVKKRYLPAFHYEHCGYHSRHSLSRLMASYEFEPLHLGYSFAEEYLQYAGIRTSPSYELDAETQGFSMLLPHIRERLLIYFQSRKGRVVLWGASGKGTSLLTGLGISYDVLPHVVDSNPRRHGNFFPITGQQIIAPERLKTLLPHADPHLPPDTEILLTTPLYRREIEEKLASLGLHVAVLTVEELIARASL